jgi:hypothetical protein
MQSLKQGEWTSDGHFAYRGTWLSDGSGSVFECNVGKSVALTIWVFGWDQELPYMKSRRFRPGDLQRADATVQPRYLVRLPVFQTNGHMTGTLGATNPVAEVG